MVKMRHFLFACFTTIKKMFCFPFSFSNVTYPSHFNSRASCTPSSLSPAMFFLFHSLLLHVFYFLDRQCSSWFCPSCFKYIVDFPRRTSNSPRAGIPPVIWAMYTVMEQCCHCIIIFDGLNPIRGAHLQDLQRVNLQPTLMLHCCFLAHGSSV